MEEAELLTHSLARQLSAHTLDTAALARQLSAPMYSGHSSFGTAAVCAYVLWIQQLWHGSCLRICTLDTAALARQLSAHMYSGHNSFGTVAICTYSRHSSVYTLGSHVIFRPEQEREGAKFIFAHNDLQG
jgi:hypothetical protein